MPVQAQLLLVCQSQSLQLYKSGSIKQHGCKLCVGQLMQDIHSTVELYCTDMGHTYQDCSFAESLEALSPLSHERVGATRQQKVWTLFGFCHANVSEQP